MKVQTHVVPYEPTPNGLDGAQWLEKLVLIAASLKEQGTPTRLTLIGGATGMISGQPGRTSIDLDVWKPTSNYQYSALKTAVESAGLLFNPKMALEPETPYIQIVEPGLTQLGKFEATEPLEQFGALTVDRPPIANIIAAKMVRAEPKDLSDIAYLLATFRPDKAAIETAIKTMPREAREKATENLVYLSVLDAPAIS